MSCRTTGGASICMAMLVLACNDVPTAPRADLQPQSVTLPGSTFSWSAGEIHGCPDYQGRLQNVYPLDEAGRLLLAARSGCTAADPVDYRVVDISLGTPAIVAEVATGAVGVRIAAHSPPGSRVGFGGRGNMLVVYDGAFRTVPLPCDGGCRWITGVWAGSPTSVWIVTGDTRAGEFPGRILRWDGTAFTVEHSGGDFTDIWGSGGPNPEVMYAVGDRIMRRERGGSWTELMSPAERPANCWDHVAVQQFNAVEGMGKNVWVVGFAACLLHYDGRSWEQLTVPAGAIALGGIVPLTPQHLLVSGQGGGNIEGRPSLWESVDGGHTWTQLGGPVFAAAPTYQDLRFFSLSATLGGNRIFAPGVGGTLFVGTRGTQPVLAAAGKPIGGRAVWTRVGATSEPAGLQPIR